MFFNNAHQQSNSLAEQTAESVEQAIKSTQRVANESFDSLAGGVQELRDQVTPLLNRATKQASALAQWGADGVRDTSHQLRDTTMRVTDHTRSYIKHEPVKAVLIAAATGAVLMGIMGMMTYSRDHR